MKALESDFKRWLKEKGYDYEIHADDFLLWIEFLKAQSDYALDSIDTVNQFETKEELDEAIRQQDKAIAKLRHEYMFWKMKNMQKYDRNAGEVELFYHFLKYRNTNTKMI